MMIRPTTPADIPALQPVLDETELFPSEMLPEMIEGFFGSKPEERWLTCENDGKAIGFCFAKPEQLTEGTWNMLAIAVSPQNQGSGFGKALVAAMENSLREEGQRILIVDTSSLDEFVPTRAFYSGLGYEKEARIRDYWSDGDDKVTFRKVLSSK